MQQKLNAKTTQCIGSDKKPSMLQTGTVKTKLSRGLMQLSLRFQKTSVKVGSPCSYGWKDIWVTKS